MYIIYIYIQSHARDSQLLIFQCTLKVGSPGIGTRRIFWKVDSVNTAMRVFKFSIARIRTIFSGKEPCHYIPKAPSFLFLFPGFFHVFFLHGTIGTMVQVCPSFKIHSSTCTAGPLRFSSRRRWWGKLSARDARNFREDQGEVSWTNGA